MSDEIENNEQSDGSGDGASQEAFNDGSEEGLVIAEEKQPVSRSTLAMFIILVVAAAGLFFMYRKTGPKAANAAVAMETVEAKKTISTFLSSGDASFKSMEARLKNVEKVVAQFRVYPSTTQLPLSSLQTNPFRQHAQVSVTAPAANPELSEAALKKKQEEERISAKKAAEGLLLQSIVCSDTRKACMINSTIYREGETCGDFVIEKVSPSTVMVKTGIYRFELKMAKEFDRGELRFESLDLKTGWTDVW